MQEREKFYIKKFKTLKPSGYNLTEGGEISTQKGEDHPSAKLTEKEVIFCRNKYSEGFRSREIYERYFKDKITYGGFQKMWHGDSWKEVMPEVFEKKKYPRKKLKEEDVMDIRKKFLMGISIMEIDKIYKDRYSHSTISKTINDKNLYPKLWPQIEDNHVRLNQKVTEEDVRLIRELKSKGYMHKEIKKALNNRLSLTTISDIVNYKRYADIK